MPPDTRQSPATANPNTTNSRTLMTPPVMPPIISRTRVGVIAIACLVFAGLLKFAGPEQAGLMSALFRVGTVMAALWLALPPKGQPLLWRNFTPVLVIALAFALLTKNPRMLVIAIPVGFVVLLLLSFRSPRRGR